MRSPSTGDSPSAGAWGHGERPGPFAAARGEEVEGGEGFLEPALELSFRNRGRKPKKTRQSVQSAKGLGARRGRTQRKEGATPVPDTPSVPIAGPSVSGAASGSRPPRRGLPPGCVCCKTAAVGGTAVRQSRPRSWAWRAGKLWTCAGQGWSRQGQRGSCAVGRPAGSSPSPAAWSSASCSSGFFGSPLPCPWRVLAGCAQQAGTWGGCSWDNTTQVRFPPNSCDPGAFWAGPERSHSEDGLGGWAKPQVLTGALQLYQP